MLSDFELEVIERDYFRYILTFLRANLTPIIDGLNSRIKILNKRFLNEREYFINYRISRH